MKPVPSLPVFEGSTATRAPDTGGAGGFVTAGGGGARVGPADATPGALLTLALAVGANDGEVLAAAAGVGPSDTSHPTMASANRAMRTACRDMAADATDTTGVPARGTFARRSWHRGLNGHRAP